MSVSKNDLEVIISMLSTIEEWEGITEDTPDDAVLIPEEPGIHDAVTSGHIRDAKYIISSLLTESRYSKDGTVKIA